MKWRCVLISCAGALTAITLSAHSGGLDKDGCHTDRKTGRYHCHSKQPSPKPLPSEPSPPVNWEPLPAVAQPTRFPINDLEVLLTAQHLLAALGYLSGLGAPTATVSLEIKYAVIGFRADHRLEGSDKIDGELLVQLSKAVAGKCSPGPPRQP